MRPNTAQLPKRPTDATSDLDLRNETTFMSLFHAISLISFIWLVINVLSHLFKPKAALLPTSNTSRPRAWSLWTGKSTTITINKVHIRIQTNTFNEEHDYLAGKLKDRRFTRLRRWVVIFYYFGIVAGICGMVLGLAALTWITLRLVIDPFSGTQKPPNHSKRDLSSETHSASFIQPIVSWVIYQHFLPPTKPLSRYPE